MIATGIAKEPAGDVPAAVAAGIGAGSLRNVVAVRAARVGYLPDSRIGAAAATGVGGESNRGISASGAAGIGSGTAAKIICRAGCRRAGAVLRLRAVFTSGTDELALSWQGKH